MKQLIIFRHAKAEPAVSGQDDKDRPLSQRGLIEARQMGADLAKRGLLVDHWLVSSSQRTGQTYACLSQSMNTATALFLDNLYNADAPTIGALLDQHQAPETVAIIGHNPGVHQFVMQLMIEAATPEAIMAPLSLGYKTCQATLFACDQFGRFSYIAHYLPAKSAS